MAETEEGADLLQWMTEQILSARVPEEIYFLLFDTKLVGLNKQSKMAADIEELAKRV